VEFSFELAGHGWGEATLSDGERHVVIPASYLSDVLSELLTMVRSLLEPWTPPAGGSLSLASIAGQSLAKTAGLRSRYLRPPAAPGRAAQTIKGPSSSIPAESWAYLRQLSRKESRPSCWTMARTATGRDGFCIRSPLDFCSRSRNYCIPDRRSRACPERRGRVGSGTSEQCLGQRSRAFQMNATAASTAERGLLNTGVVVLHCDTAAAIDA